MLGAEAATELPRLATAEPFFLLDPADLVNPLRRPSSIAGATRSARQVRVNELEPVDLLVTTVHQR